MILNSKECVLKSQGASRKQKPQYQPEAIRASSTDHMVLARDKHLLLWENSRSAQYLQFHCPMLPSTKDPSIYWKAAIIPQLAISALQATSPTPENSASLDIPE